MLKIIELEKNLQLGSHKVVFKIILLVFNHTYCTLVQGNQYKCLMYQTFQDKE